MLNLSQNYFELFGIPVQFHIDLDGLAGRYRDVQKLVHPDRFANASDHEKRLAMQGATLINEAFQTLKNPLKRAQYMLSLRGVDAAGDNQTTSDTAFLMQQMELREALGEIRDADDPMLALGELLEEIGRMIRVQVAQLAILLESDTDNDLQEAKGCVYKMQFLNKLHAEAEALEGELEDMI
jgi:molecular chaperone HscB